MALHTDETHTVYRRNTGMAKITRYGWTILDAPGTLILIRKDELKVHPAYQRRVSEIRVNEIVSAWSWVACGAIIVGQRKKDYWVIDGQHRVLAAVKRADITTLPCLVFTTEDTAQEARGFINANTARGSMSTIDKYRALIAANDEMALYLQKLFAELRIVPKGFIPPANTSTSSLDSLGWVMDHAKINDRKDLELIMRLVSELCADSHIRETLLGGLHYLHINHETDGLNNKRLRERIIHVGAATLVEGAIRASAYYTKGGAKIWARGMLDEINKNLHNKIEIPNV